MTKEPKLHSAVRIVKEWPDLDNEVRRLQERVAAQTPSSKSESAKPSGMGNSLVFHFVVFVPVFVCLLLWK